MMIDIREAIPANAMHSTDYLTLINSTGVEVLHSEMFGSYQGDYFMIVKENGKWGLLVFGYGSCSGCDALEACSTYEDLNRVRISLYNNIFWADSSRELFKALMTKDWKRFWFGNEEGAFDVLVGLAKWVETIGE